MIRNRISKAWMATATLALLAVSLAPAAQADGHGWGRHHKDSCYGGGYRQSGWGGSSRVIVHHSSSSVGPALAGFVGGLALGAVLSSSHHSHAYACAQPQYSYYDPYCRESFASLDVAWSHERCARHPRIIRQIDASNGQCVHSYQWCRNGWENADQYGGGYGGNGRTCERDRGYSDRGCDRRDDDRYYDDRGYDDRRYDGRGDDRDDDDDED